jgi:hypothetical protein
MEEFKQMEEMKCEGVLRVVKERKKIIKRKMDKSIICVR